MPASEDRVARDLTQPTIRSEGSLISLTATQALTRIACGELSIETYLRALCAQAELAHSINALSRVNAGKVIARACELDRALSHGGNALPLMGLPVALKDNMDTRGDPTSAGTAIWRAHEARAHCELMQRLESQGAILLGKTHMHELAAGATSINPTFGAVHNPYDRLCIAGGSSGGSAAAVSARVVPVSFGTDTGGSVRVPAAFCGVVGYRPTARPSPARYSLGGVVPFVRELDAIGVFARSVEDIGLIDAAIRGAPMPDLTRGREMRLGLLDGACQSASAEVSSCVDTALGRLRASGFTLVRLARPAWLSDVREAFSTLFLSGLANDIRAHVAASAESPGYSDFLSAIVSADVRDLLRSAQPSSFPAHHMESISRVRQVARLKYHAMFSAQALDAVIAPTCPIAAPVLASLQHTDGTLRIEQGASVGELVMRNALSASALGVPSISIPIGLTARGLPVGLLMDGAAGKDLDLLNAACLAEAAVGIVPPSSSLSLR